MMSTRRHIDSNNIFRHDCTLKRISFMKHTRQITFSCAHLALLVVFFAVLAKKFLSPALSPLALSAIAFEQSS